MDLDKLRSISTPRRIGSAERTIRREGEATVIETEHWDGRQDATVRPDVLRYGARAHSTGQKRGEVAEVRTLNSKERKERYGPGR